MERGTYSLFKISEGPKLSLVNMMVQTMPLGTPFTDPLKGMLPFQGATVYNYVYVYVIRIPVDVAISTSALAHLDITHCPCQLYVIIYVIDIGSFALVKVSNFISLTIFDFI